ncbi:MAG TPA: DNA-binding response regulator, partial [Solibacterales bacterium]|nr:DNA-binding response regulator [Bryobacterales bacterium]
RALLRRAAPDQPKILQFADTEVDIERRVVTRRKEEVKLTPSE